MVLTGSSLMIGDIEHFFLYLLTVRLLWIKFFSDLLHILEIELFFAIESYTFLEYLVLTPCQLYDLKIFSSIWNITFLLH